MGADLHNPEISTEFENMTTIPRFSFAQLTATRHFLRALLCVAGGNTVKKVEVAHKVLGLISLILHLQF